MIDLMVVVLVFFRIRNAVAIRVEPHVVVLAVSVDHRNPDERPCTKPERGRQQEERASGRHQWTHRGITSSIS
jgi:hypothetical protein